MSHNNHGTLNEVRLIGRLGTDPEMRYTPSGIAVTTLSVCTKRSWTAGSGEEKQEIEWHKVTVWGRQAEVCNQYLTKGSRVEIAGSIHYTKWEDRERGQMRYGVEIRAQRVLFLDPKPEAGAVEVEDLSSDLGNQPEPEPAAAPVIEQPKKRQRRPKRVAA